jgi:hypothetical protein
VRVCLRASRPCGGSSPRLEGRMNRVSNPAPRMRLPPADPCSEVGGYVRGVAEKRLDPPSQGSRGLLAPCSWPTACRPMLRGA